MPRRLKIRTKLVAILSATTLVATGVTSTVGYHMARQTLEQESFRKLTAVREMKASQVEDYFRQIFDQIVTFSEDRMIIDAMRRFRSAFTDFSAQATVDPAKLAAADLELRLYYQKEFLPRLNPNLDGEAPLSAYWPTEAGVRALQYLLIATNPFETGTKHLLEDTGAAGRYDLAHRLYHPIVRSFLERFGYYDIFLVDHETGHIVYSVFKEVDFGTSLLSGPYRDTNFARAFRAARDATAREFVRLVDFEPYHPSYNAQASFIASPIFDGDEKIGVLVFQMPVDRINDIMTSKRDWSRVGLGESGETYIVGDDLRLRTEPRFLIEDKDDYLRSIERSGVAGSTVRRIANLDSAIGLQEARTEGTVAALQGDTGTAIFSDYRGIPVLSAYRPLTIPDVAWAIMSEIDEAEAFKTATRLRTSMIVGLGALAVVIVIIAFLFARTLTLPLQRLSQKAAELAEGNLDRVVDTDGGDEIGDLSRSFDRMRCSLQELVSRQAAAIEALSTPLIPVHDEIVVVPLVGELDPARIENVRQSLVEGLHASAARVAIVDITGVPAFGADVADGLARAARAARLLGAQVIITGMRPELARDLAALDTLMEGLMTERSLARGIELALGYVRER